MSFSSNIKEELSRNETGARHCKIAEIAGFLRFGGNISLEPEHYEIQIQTETVSAAKRFYKLIKDVFDIHAKIDVGRNEFLKRSRNYTISVDKHKDCVLILKAVKLLDSKEFGLVLQNTCCKRAYIRGAFQAAGSMSDPEKNYHFEVVSTNVQTAEQLKEVLNFFDLDAKIVLRKKYYVVYMKEGSKIVDVLNIMEAHVALMELENVRILKDMRNKVNRRVNCETANINKTVSAAVKQVEDIEYIDKHKGLRFLDQGLQDIARLRLEHPEATLKELGDRTASRQVWCEPPVKEDRPNCGRDKIGRTGMISKNVKVEVALREEDRPIAFLVQMASQFESKILFETGNKQVNVKSMMGMMSLGLDLDRLEDLTVVADGVDEEEAISKIEYYLTKGA